MKTEIEHLIDRLASKELTFGCRILFNQKAGLENPYNQIEGFVYHNYGHSDWTDDEEISAIFYDRTIERNYRKSRVSERRRFGVKKNHVKVLGHDIMIGDIIARLINVGAPLNDNVLGFNKEQRSFLFDIKHLAEQILDSD